MKQIEIENLSLHFGEKIILNQINTKINKGDIVALTGANGSGKSTLMRCIVNILNNYKGKIKLEESNLKEIPNIELAKKIAYVPQYETKISGIKVFDMVLSGRMPYINWKPSEKDYQIVSNVMNTLKISNLSLRDFRELSGGQQQMAYIARAIVQETSIILLDEPTNNLDIKHQIEIMEVLKKLSQEGKTIIITLHDINLALRYCHKYILLKSGEILIQGNKEVINPQNLENLYGVKMKILKDGDSTFVTPIY